jgi:hypothetical protein
VSVSQGSGSNGDQLSNCSVTVLKFYVPYSYSLRGTESNIQKI